ncbi:Ubiquitin carboxyl-terminal hydrolase 15, partial [Coemansia sp. RSA 2599]
MSHTDMALDETDSATTAASSAAPGELAASALASASASSHSLDEPEPEQESEPASKRLLQSATNDSGHEQRSTGASPGPIEAEPIEAQPSETEPTETEHFLCGLSNLGNTCFMNSALQCVGHIPELADYFVSGTYRSEVNRTNPLGMQGAVALAYGRLVQAMWSAGRGVYAPRGFKQTIAQWAP